MSILLDKAKDLPVPERIKLVQDIWDTIAAEPAAIKLTREQVEELDRRIEHHQLHPEDSVPWETVRDEALARI